MSVTAQAPMTLDAFLDWEERQDRPWEFDGYQPVAITGGTRAHDTIAFNLRRALHGRLRGMPCQAHGPNLKIEAAGSVRYPDVFVSCTPFASDATIAPLPVVVFEVISDGTSRIDRVDKLRAHYATPSIRSYVIVEQTSAAVTHYGRRADDPDAPWQARALTAEDTLALPEIGVELSVADLYLDVSLDQSDPT